MKQRATAVTVTSLMREVELNRGVATGSKA